MINKQDFAIEAFPDGAVCLSCGDEEVLVFEVGAMRGDPALKKQWDILVFILSHIRGNAALDEGTEMLGCEMGIYDDEEPSCATK
jgi:hypothetical protein